MNDDPDGKNEYEDGWLYYKRPKGKYRIMALMYSEVPDSFRTRNYVIKQVGDIQIVHEEWDYEERPPHAIEISEARARKQIKKWKRLAKTIWV